MFPFGKLFYHEITGIGLLTFSVVKDMVGRDTTVELGCDNGRMWRHGEEEEKDEVEVAGE